MGSGPTNCILLIFIRTHVSGVGRWVVWHDDDEREVSEFYMY